MSLFKLTALIQSFSLLRVPLLGILRPKVVTLNAQEARVRIPFSFLARNHVGSMYFGALAIGAELAVALRVVEAMLVHKTPVTFIFKDFKCEFLKRAEGPTDFCCLEVTEIDALIKKALELQERVEGTFSGFACSKNDNSHSAQPYMTFQITLSVKAHSRKK